MSQSGRVEPSYLTCTAAQADEFNTSNSHGLTSLNQLLEQRAYSHPDNVVAGFPENVQETRWEVVMFTYKSLLVASNVVAHSYLEKTTLCARLEQQKEDRIIGLLSPSCADLLVTLFAALRLGYGVLLLAPQNTPQAIRHLCEVTSCTHLICHPSLKLQGHKALQDSNICIIDLAPRLTWQNISANLPLLPLALSAREEKDLTALVMHTSGSTGMPKPVYQPHRIWTEAIPCIPGKPAFTTTPLFHGGSADILRSMNALSILYMFPSTYPVTVTNVLGAMSACPDVTAFLSVPYILKLLVEDTRGMQMLRKMELVSTGGAPLPEALGDEMVKCGVKLVSRLGSSECGFLMSSHRCYESDLEWSWLRNDGPGEKLLLFEPVSDSADTFELIVPEGWSTRVVSNRDDGSFATGDLYNRHPTIPHAWRYCGRVDDIIVMTNGKKVSANPIETALCASPHVAEAIVFGASRAALGTLIVPASSAAIKHIKACVLYVNQCGASYARIPDELVIILPPDSPLPKTSKGSVVRPKALIQYATTIEEAYERLEKGDAGDMQFVTNTEIRQYVRRLIQDAVISQRGLHTTEIEDDADFFALGIDSIQAITIRSSLQKLLSSSAAVLGTNVVLDYPSVNRLTAHILDVRVRQETAHPTEERQRQHEKMREFVDFYGTFVDSTEGKPQAATCAADIVVLTGATGALGVHTLYQIVGMSALQVVALVRAENHIRAKERIQASLQQRKLPSVEISAGFPPGGVRCPVVALAADLALDRLGLGENEYDLLAARLKLVLHVAWPVNFALSLDSFSPILQGTRNLIMLTIKSSTGHFVFCSSTAAVSAGDNNDKDCGIQECLPASENCAASMGYAQSKWVAEHMCARAYDGPLRSRVTIARVGQLCGDTVHGVWNQSEAWPLLIATVRYTRCLPDLDEHPRWLPVDVCARILIRASFSDMPYDRVPVYHLVNTDRTTSWSDIQDYLARAGLAFECVSAGEWLERLRECEASLDGATKNLLALWESKYRTTNSSARLEPNFDTSQIARTCPGFREMEPVSEDLIHRICQSWQESGFLQMG
ncbi:hypothetical protein NM688_g2610 [Phlebia brevispora]|uniref:Uncharacterized protein n=1 Tax=Phlebia brevispora TaxID=194682 RepID=A0ACC1T885_9APHY|nr:hypothetical protein NM688_g2610 [Phlebia brevispora]